MPRRFVMALALVSALTGCVGSPPDGPLVECRAGLTPITRPVQCPATYVLQPVDPPGAPLAEHHVAKGERIGFRREDDGSVSAVAPGYTIALPPGAYAWAVVPASVPPFRERLLCETRERALAAGRATAITAAGAGLLALGLGLTLLYAYAKSEGGNGRIY